MKETGMIRQLDSLGRIVLPIELRRMLDINSKDTLEILVDGSTILLRKYEKSCQFCNGSQGLTEFRGKLICKRCLREIKDL